MLRIQLFLNFAKKWGRIPPTCRKSLTITHTINTINYVVLPSQGLRSAITIRQNSVWTMHGRVNRPAHT